MPPTDARIRARTVDDVVFLALPDVAAMLLDAAATVSDAPDPADEALRSLASGLVQYGQEG